MDISFLDGCRSGVVELAPSEPVVTEYDHAHMLTYERLLDAERDGHKWSVVAVEVLDLDVSVDGEGARRCWRSHLKRPHWRSEEHTSELPSPMRSSYAFFCLKKTTHNHNTHTNINLSRN